MMAMILASAAGAAVAAAPDDDAAPPAADAEAVALAAPASDIEITFVAGAWLTRVNGTVKLGPAPADEIELQTQLNVDSYEAAFNAELAILKDNFWRIGFSGFDFSAESSGVFSGSAQFGNLALNDGDPFTASFDITSIAAELALWWWQPYCQDNSCRVALSAGPVFGVRWASVEQNVSAPGGTQSAEGEWTIPYAGFEIELRARLPENIPLFESFTLNVGAATGPALGGDGGWGTHLHAGITGFVCPTFGVGLGYRLIHLNVENDDYEFNGGLQGLFVSATIRF